MSFRLGYRTPAEPFSLNMIAAVPLEGKAMEDGDVDARTLLSKLEAERAGLDARKVELDIAIAVMRRSLGLPVDAPLSAAGPNLPAVDRDESNQRKPFLGMNGRSESRASAMGNGA